MRQFVVAVNGAGHAVSVRHCGCGIEQRPEPFAAHGMGMGRGKRFLHARHGEIEISAGPGMARAGRLRRGQQAPQVIRHQMLDAEIDAQVLAQIENELEAQRVVAVAHENRQP